MASITFSFVVLWTLFTFQLVFSAHSSQVTISYTEDVDGLTFVGNTVYPDGTVILRLGRFESSLKDCYEQNLTLRIVYPNGTIVPLSVNHSIESFNFCRTYSNYPDSAQDLIRIDGINNKYVLIRHVTADDVLNFTNAKVNGLIVDLDGKILSQEVLGAVNFPIHSTRRKMDVGAICPNAVPNGGFLFYSDDNDSSGFHWTQFKNGLDNGELKMQKNGTLKQEENLKRPKIWSTGFSTLDGGYALIGAYNMTANDKTPVDPLYRVQITFFKPMTDDQSGPFIIYQSMISGATTSPMECSAANSGIGYVCIAQSGIPVNNKNDTSEDFFQSINFLTSGSIRETKTLQIPPTGSPPDTHPLQLFSLKYGGYLQKYFYVSDNTSFYNGTILDDNGTTVEEWGLGNPFKLPNDFGSVSVYLPNNTYMLFYISNEKNKWVGVSTPLKKFYPDELGFDSRNIKQVTPTLNTTIKSEDITIIYNTPIKRSSGKLIIYQVNPRFHDDREDFPRLICSAEQSRCQLNIVNDNTIKLKVLSSTFNQPKANYYVQIDSGFVEIKDLGEPVPGIFNRTWMFNYQNDPQDTFADSATGVLRLTVDGSNYFTSLNSHNRNEFFDQLKSELIMAIPVDPNRISTKGNFQHDPSTSNQQILISFDIARTRDPYQRSTKTLIEHLDEMVKQKDISPISFYNHTSYLDQKYGFSQTPNLWEKYKTKLLILFLALLFILVLFIMARIRHNEGNNFAIIQIALIILDFGLDLAFLLNNGRDVSWIFLPSLFFVVIPIVCNCTIAFSIFLHEHEHNQKFLEWSNKNVKFVPAFTVLAAADIEALNILGSRLAGLNAFSAPFSEKAMASIFWASTFNMFIEDLPQLIIQVLYRRNTVSYDIIPLLTLVTSAVMLTINILGRIYQVVHYLRQGQLRYANTSMYVQEEKVDEQDPYSDSEGPPTALKTGETQVNPNTQGFVTATTEAQTRGVNPNLNLGLNPHESASYYNGTMVTQDTANQYPALSFGASANPIKNNGDNIHIVQMSNTEDINDHLHNALLSEDR